MIAAGTLFGQPAIMTAVGGRIRFTFWWQLRPAPSDCRSEPPYPGLQTVVFALSAPDLTVHNETVRCYRDEPHPISDCGEWQGWMMIPDHY